MEEGTRPVHPHPHTPPRVPTRPTEVGDDAVGAEDGLQDGGESLHHRVVDGPRKARAVAADGVVTRAEGGEGGVTDVPGAGATDNGPVGRRVSRGRDEEQIKGEGGDEVGRRAESDSSRVFIKDSLHTTLFTVQVGISYGICWRHGNRCCVSVSLSEVWEDAERTCQPVALYLSLIHI